jgi:Holliday junction resolvase RusA-like endonuclease
MARKDLTFWIPGQPIGKGRPRFARGRAYTPPITHRAQVKVAAIASGAMIEAKLEPFTAPVSVIIVARYRIPPSWTKAKRVEAETHAIVPGKPDLDNVIKLVLDACNGVCFEDDAQVAWIEAIKTFSDEPGIMVKLSADQ